MQTRTYGDLFKLASALIGTGGELSTGEQDQLSHFINRRFSEIFNASPSWPRYITVGEPRPIERNQIVPTLGESYYVSGAGSEEANGFYLRNGFGEDGAFAYSKFDSDGNETMWLWGEFSGVGQQYFWKISPTAPGVEPDLPLYQGIGTIDGPPTYQFSVQSGDAPGPFAQYLSNIGEFVRLHSTQPLLNRSAREYEFYVTSSGAHILNVESTTDNTAWVTYKKEFTPYTITADYYTSTLEVPAEFFNFISHAVYADFLRVQNKQEEALAEEQAAQTFLALELEKIDLRSNNNTINKKFSTYVNRQAR